MRTSIFNIAPGNTIDYHGHLCLVLEHRKDGILLCAVTQTRHDFGSNNNFAVSRRASKENK